MGIFGNGSDDPYHDGTFMIEVLSANSSRNRDYIWMNKWKRIIFVLRPEPLQIIMNLCLGNRHNVAFFKKIYMCDYSEISDYTWKMVEKKFLKELSEFLKFITDDPVVIFDLRIRILKSTYFLKYYVYSLRYTNEKILFDEFVNETFQDADQLNEFKRYLIMSEESMKHFRSMIEKGRLHLGLGIEKFCEHVLSSMPDVLSQAKNKLLEVARDVLISAQFERSSSIVWDEFLKWCLNNDDLLMEFKDTLPVDEIFIKLMGRLARRLVKAGRLTLENPGDENKLKNPLVFEELDFFLHWFFKDHNRILDYKLDKLRARNDIKEIRSLIESNKRVVKDVVLNWFASDNYE
ncbi:hypothetical protein U1Q18_051360 [Sarracenia purpurea var. burkii]